MATVLHKVLLSVRRSNAARLEREVDQHLKEALDGVETVWELGGPAFQGNWLDLELIVRSRSAEPSNYNEIVEVVMQTLVVHGIQLRREDVSVRFLEVAEASNPIQESWRRHQLDFQATTILERASNGEGTSRLEGTTLPDQEQLRIAVVTLLQSLTEVCLATGRFHYAIAAWEPWACRAIGGLDLRLHARFTIHRVALAGADVALADRTYLRIQRFAQAYSSADAWAWIAARDFDRRDQQKAAEAVEKALQLEPHHPRALSILKALGKIDVSLQVQLDFASAQGLRGISEPDAGLDIDDGRVEVDEGPRTRSE